MNAAADSICFQVFEEFKVEGWIVVDNETELFGGACDDAVKVAERIVGGVAGLEMAGWIIEETAVEDDSDFVKFHTAGWRKLVVILFSRGIPGPAARLVSRVQPCSVR